MAKGNAKRMRELVETFNRRDVATTASALDEFVVWDARQLWVPELQAVYQGTAGVAEFWRDWLPMWERVTSEILWIEEIDDHVVMWMRQTQVGRGSGVEVTLDYGWDVTFRHGKIIRVSFFNDEDGARSRESSISPDDRARTQSRSLLDLSDARLDQLMSQVGELAAREVRATQRGPVFAQPPASATVRQALGAGGAPLPREPEELESVLKTAAEALTLGRRSSPRFFGYVFSPSTPVAIAGDALASAADQNVTSWRSAPSATEIEWLTLRWLAEFVGFRSDAGGLFVSGGSLAHLTVALIALRARGLDHGDRRRLSMFVSEQAHFSLDKAAIALGVNLRRVATDDRLRMDPDALTEAIAADREKGNRPFCIVATAGTTPTGAVDPIASLADIAAAEEAWLHVDGAYGAPAAATNRARALFAGLERADSISIDAHKWLYVPVDCSALLLRDPSATRGVFGHADDYVKVLHDDSGEAFAFWDHGFELSRRSRALKLWMTFKAYGAEALARSIEEDIELADLMGQLVRDAEDLELVCEPSLSVCCFRHRPANVADEDLNTHNEALLSALQRDGRAYLSNVTLAGRFALRACITNFRTTNEDIRETVRLVQELGNTVSGRSRSARN